MTDVVPAFQSPRRTGRDNFYVRVHAKEDDLITLDVFRTTRELGHGDFDFEKSFALQLLWVFPNLLGLSSHALSERVPFETFLDPDATLDASEAVIEEFGTEETRNYPLDEAALDRLSDDAYTAFWNDAANLPYARFSIRVTDARWIAHLEAGLDYESPAHALD